MEINSRWNVIFIKNIIILKFLHFLEILNFRRAKFHLLFSPSIGQYLCFTNSHYVTDNTKACLYPTRMWTGLEAYRCGCGFLFTADIVSWRKKKLIYMRKGSRSSSDISLQVFYSEYRILYILQVFCRDLLSITCQMLLLNQLLLFHLLVSTTIKKKRKNPNQCTRHSAIDHNLKRRKKFIK